MKRILRLFLALLFCAQIFAGGQRPKLQQELEHVQNEITEVNGSIISLNDELSDAVSEHDKQLLSSLIDSEQKKMKELQQKEAQLTNLIAKYEAGED